MQILRIIRTDSDLKYRIESELGSSVPKEHPSENPGCCSRLARCLIGEPHTARHQCCNAVLHGLCSMPPS